MRKGFTLIELAIVLVVIGLLIGGVLVSRSLIDSARISSIIKESGQVQIAFRLFNQQYGYLPGDYPKATALGAPYDGNGNGIIDCGWQEQINVFYELTAAGYLQTHLEPQPCCHSNVVLDQTMMQSTAFKDMYWVTGSVSGTFPSGPLTYTDICSRPATINSPTEDKVGDNYISIARNYTTAPSLSSAVYGFQPPFLRALDAKVDDGSASTGIFRVGVGLQGSNWQGCITGADYLNTDIAWGIAPELGCAGAFKLINY